jgi:hypothetical protein
LFFEIGVATDTEVPEFAGFGEDKPLVFFENRFSAQKPLRFAKTEQVSVKSPSYHPWTAGSLSSDLSFKDSTLWGESNFIL